jgi:hypothetical protein
MTVAYSPLTVKELRTIADEDSYVTVTVPVSLDDLIDYDLEGILDLLCDKVGIDLSDINYSVAGTTPDGCILVSVTGDISLSLEYNEEYLDEETSK